jgi:hypothetical protein
MQYYTESTLRHKNKKIKQDPGFKRRIKARSLKITWFIGTA